MTGLAYIHARIFVEQEFVFFLATALRNERIEFGYKFDLVGLCVRDVILFGVGGIANYRFDLPAALLFSTSVCSCLPSFCSPVVTTAAVMIRSSVIAKCVLYPKNAESALL